MERFGNIEDVLDFAVSREIEAERFYLGLAGRTKRKAMREVFSEFAKEERGHRANLERVRKAGGWVATEKVQELKIADYTVESETSEEMDYKDAVLAAIKKEGASNRLYEALAERAEDEKVRDMFLMLAQEEARHKHRFEVEYDDMMKEG